MVVDGTVVDCSVIDGFAIDKFIVDGDDGVEDELLDGTDDILVVGIAVNDGDDVEILWSMAQL